jgi:RNA polymerase sigma factor (sigma-70 family)
MKTERLRQKYPMFYAFGEQQTFPTEEDLVNSDVHTRIRSIWPFAVQKVMKFHESLKPREQANTDPEDLLSDLYIMLVEKNGQWQPERGRYITYAGKLIVRELLAIRDRSRTIQSPRNATSRMKDYQACDENGTLTERRRETYGQLSRTVENAKPMPSDGVAWRVDDDHVEEVAERDLGEHELGLISKAIRKLPPTESLVLGWASGLWGSGFCTHQEIADRLSRSVEDVRDIKASAYAKIRWYVQTRRKNSVAAS